VQESMLAKLCEILAYNSKADSVVLVECFPGNGGAIRGAYGCATFHINDSPRIPLLGEFDHPTLVEQRLARTLWFKAHPLANIAPLAKGLVAMVIPKFSGQNNWYFALFFCRDAKRCRDTDLGFITKIIDLTRSLLAEEEGFREGSTSIANVDVPKNSDVAILAFLQNTLIKGARLHSKDGMAYLTVRKWKSQVKDSQIAALEGLKIVPSEIAAAAIAHELFQTANTVFSGPRFDGVIPIPGGSSGMSRSLSVCIAEQLAKLMKVPLVLALEGELSSGRSHPRKSQKLKSYQLKEALVGHFLLIDDVVSSGRHLSFACKALKNVGATCSTLVWLGN
jgi:hypothetical protein